MTTKLHLIIAPLNESGQIMALNPQEFTNLGPCTIEEYGKRMKVAADAMEVAKQINSVHLENAMRTKLIFDGMVTAGMLPKSGKIDLSFLKPWFLKFIKEYESTQTFWKKWQMRIADKNRLFWDHVKIVGTGLLSKYGTKLTLLFRGKSGK
jgi:hypothetical protein